MAIYDVTYSLISERLLPPFKRTPILLSYLNAALKPLQTLRDWIFDDYYNGGTEIDGSGSIIGINERLKYNSQTILLEYILNNALGTTSITITNSDVTAINYKYFFQASEISANLPTLDLNQYFYLNNGDLNPLYLFQESEQPTYFDGTEYINRDTVTPYIMYLSGDFLLSYDFTINISSAEYTALGTTETLRSGLIKGETDKYNLIGINYRILTF